MEWRTKATRGLENKDRGHTPNNFLWEKENLESLDLLLTYNEREPFQAIRDRELHNKASPPHSYTGPAERMFFTHSSPRE
jgi:hypothetical protein